jgi:hypothetical protein
VTLLTVAVGGVSVAPALVQVSWHYTIVTVLPVLQAIQVSTCWYKVEHQLMAFGFRTCCTTFCLPIDACLGSPMGNCPSSLLASSCLAKELKMQAQGCRERQKVGSQVLTMGTPSAMMPNMGLWEEPEVFAYTQPSPASDVVCGWVRAHLWIDAGLPALSWLSSCPALILVNSSNAGARHYHACLLTWSCVICWW